MLTYDIDSKSKIDNRAKIQSGGPQEKTCTAISCRVPRLNRGWAQGFHRGDQQKEKNI